MTNPTLTQDSTVGPATQSSFLYALTEALINASNVAQTCQMINAIEVQVNAKLEEETYNLNDANLEAQATAMAGLTNQNDISIAQAQYSTSSAIAQTSQNLADQRTQLSQTIESQDGTNLQNLLSLGSVISSVMSSLASLISQKLA